MNFGFGKEYKPDDHNDIVDNQIIGYAEDMKCGSSREDIIKKSLNTEFGVVIRIKVKTLKKNYNELIDKENLPDIIDNENLILLPNDLPIFQDEEVSAGIHQNVPDKALINNDDDLPSSSNSEEPDDNTDVTAKPITGIIYVPSMFDRILNFIREQILSVFRYSNF